MKKKSKTTKKSPAKKVTRAKGPLLVPMQSNKTGVIPLGDRVLVKPLSPDELENKITSFGIIIPDSAKEKPEQGTVMAVGPGRRSDDKTLIPVSVSIGDRIMFSKYGFDEVKVNGVEYYLVSEQNILAVLK